MADPKNPILGMPKTKTGMAEKDPASPFSPVVSYDGGGVINQPKFPDDRAGEAKETLTVTKHGDSAPPFNPPTGPLSGATHEGNPVPGPAGHEGNPPNFGPSAAQQKAKVDFDAAQAEAKAEVVAEKKIENERKVKVKLLCDVWISDPTHEDAGKDGIRRVKTNIPVLDEHGNAKVDPKSKAPITTHSIVELPLSVAKMMLEGGKAERMDPL